MRVHSCIVNPLLVTPRQSNARCSTVTTTDDGAPRVNEWRDVGIPNTCPK